MTVRLVIVTGMSGAGKTQAIKCLEDLGFFCVDNLPATFIPKMAELCQQSDGHISRLAVGIDIRGGQFFKHVMSALEELEKQGFAYEILFLEASDEALVRRYKETRHRHPLDQGGGVLDALARERRMLGELRGRASHIIDTSALAVKNLRQEVLSTFGREGKLPPLFINVVSFGFKHGVPVDADLLFDVRFLPNPHYVGELKDRTGEDAAVVEYVTRWPVTTQFFRKLTNLIGFLVPQYITEGKPQLTIAIGCTGGQHRSVVMGDKLANWLRERGYTVSVEHRDAHRSRLEEDR